MARHNWTERQVEDEISPGMIKRLLFWEKLKADKEQQDIKSREKSVGGILPTGRHRMARSH